MEKKYTGIEIGSYSVKMTQCAGNCVYRTAVEPLPDNYMKGGSIVSMEAMSAFLRQMAKKYRFTDKNCALVLPDDSVFTRRLTMPAMTVEHLKLNLPYEFHDFLNGSREQYVFDYCVLDMKYDEKKNPVSMDLMAAAVPVNLMEGYKQMIRQAGFKLVIAAPETAAIANILREHEGVEEIKTPEEYCLMDIGHRETRLHIFTGNRFEVTREIEIGVKDLVDLVAAVRNVDPHLALSYVRDNYEDVWNLEEAVEIYDRIGGEAMRAVNFYGFNNRDSHLSRIYYYGGGSRITPMTETITSHIALEQRPVTELVTMMDETDENIISSLMAAGITYQ